MLEKDIFLSEIKILGDWEFTAEGSSSLITYLIVASGGPPSFPSDCSPPGSLPLPRAC